MTYVFGILAVFGLVFVVGAFISGDFYSDEEDEGDSGCSSGFLSGGGGDGGGDGGCSSDSGGGCGGGCGGGGGD